MEENMRQTLSYSSMLKSEIAHLDKGGGRHCLISELYAMIKMSSIMLEKYGECFILMNTDNAFLAERFLGLLNTSFDFRAEASIRTSSKSRKKNYLIYVMGENATRVVKAVEGGMILKQLCCKQAYLRGIFLGCASISDPEKNYHLEFVFPDNKLALELMDVLKDFDINAGVIIRKKSHVVYIKDGEKISQILGLIGARKHLLDFENLRVFKTVSNEINRKVNCETANIAKTAKAFVSFQEDIEYIERSRGIAYLPDPLIEVASVKLEHPGATLKELGEMLSPPISKSGVNHRLRKISEIAEKLRGGLHD